MGWAVFWGSWIVGRARVR